MIKDNSGNEIESPLYHDLLKVSNGDAQKARSLWSLLDNDEMRAHIESLPEDLRHYYPNTKEANLFVYMNASDKLYEIAINDISNIFGDLNDLDINDMSSLSKVSEFTKSPWYQYFGLKSSFKGNKVTYIPTLRKKLDRSEGLDKIGNQVLFAEKLMKDISAIFSAIGISENKIQEMLKKFRADKQYSIYAPEKFASILFKTFKYFENTRIPQSIPREIGFIFKELGSNNPLYARIMNILDTKYKDYLNESDYNRNGVALSEEELKEIAFCNIIALSINKRPIRNNSELNSLADRFINSMSTHFSSARNIYIRNSVFEHGIRPDAIKKAVYQANNGTKVLEDGKFFEIYPELKIASENATLVDKMQIEIQKIIKTSAKFIAIEEAMESRSRMQTFSFEGLKEGTEDEDDLRRDLVRDADNLNYHLIKYGGSIDRLRLTELLNSKMAEIERIIDFLEKQEKIIENINQETTVFDNNEIAENLISYKFAIDYLLQLKQSFDALESFENNMIASEKNEGKRRQLENSRFYTAKHKEVFDSMNTCIFKFRNFYYGKMKELLTTELESTFKNQTLILPDGQSVTYKEYLEYGEKEGFPDLGIDRWLSSMAMCNNGLLSTLSQYKKRATQAAMDRTNMQRDRIVEAAERLRKATGTKDQSFMFEKEKVYDSDGNFVGYGDRVASRYIMDFDANAYDIAYNEMWKSLKDNKSISYETKKKLIKEWVLDHTEERPEWGGDRFPSRSAFPNGEFNKLSDEQQEYWKTFMEIKADLESQFPNTRFRMNNAILVRKNKSEFIKDAKGLKGKFKAIGRIWHDLWNIISTDEEYYTDSLRDFKSNPIYVLPIYYSRLTPGESMEEISLDTTSSLVTYARVLNNSAELSSILGLLEGAVDVMEGDGMENRIKTYNKIAFEKVLTKNIEYIDRVFKPTGKRNDVDMYKDFLRRQVYGKYQSGNMSKRTRVLLNGFMKFTAIRTLGLKLNTAIANIVQGTINFIPTLAKGIYFSGGDFAKGFGLYLKNIPSMLWNVGSNTTTSKASLFSRELNVMQDFDENVQNLDYRKSKFARLIDSSPLFMFMHMGEHLMQHTTAFSLINNKANLLSDKDGNQYNLYDAYEEYQDKDNNGIKRIKLKSGLTVNINGEVKTIVTKEEMEQRRHEWDTRTGMFEGLEKGIPYRENRVLLEGEISESDYKNYISQKILALNQYMHGIYNKEDSNAAQGYAILNLALMYRRFLYPSFKRRYGGKIYNAQLGMEFEGYYRTVGRFITSFAKELNGKDLYKYDKLPSVQQGIVYDAFHKDNPSMTIDEIKTTFNSLTKVHQREILYGNKSAWNAVSSNFSSKNDRGNIKAAMAETFTLLSLMVSNLLLILLSDDDDDDVLLAETKYQLRRAQTELSAVNAISIPVGTAYNVAAYGVGNFSDINLGICGDMLSEFTQIVNSPIVGWDVFNRGKRYQTILSPKAWQEDYEGNNPIYEDDSKGLAALKQEFRFLHFWDDFNVYTLHEQKKWYENKN